MALYLFIDKILQLISNRWAGGIELETLLQYSVLSVITLAPTRGQIKSLAPFISHLYVVLKLRNELINAQKRTLIE